MALDQSSIKKKLFSSYVEKKLHPGKVCHSPVWSLEEMNCQKLEWWVWCLHLISITSFTTFLCGHLQEIWIFHISCRRLLISKIIKVAFLKIVFIVQSYYSISVGLTLARIASEGLWTGWGKYTNILRTIIPWYLII